MKQQRAENYRAWQISEAVLPLRVVLQESTPGTSLPRSLTYFNSNISKIPYTLEEYRLGKLSS